MLTREEILIAYVMRDFLFAHIVTPPPPFPPQKLKVLSILNWRLIFMASELPQ
jgi:hypothetical protein